MTTDSTATDRTEHSTNWQVDYDVAPIEIRDPVAEALGVLEPGDPFVITYRDAVKEAGHSCPTASGAYRIVQLGLDALYADEHPVRSEIEVQAAGPRDDAAYGVMSRIISFVTGATEDDGFGGLAPAATVGAVISCVSTRSTRRRRTRRSVSDEPIRTIPSP